MLYALVVAIGRDPLPGANSRIDVQPLQQLTPPQRLQPAPGIEENTMPVVEGDQGNRVDLMIRIDKIPAFLDNDEAGIATFDSKTGSDFRWLPLKEAHLTTDLGWFVASEAPAGSRITVTLAAQREHARHGYVTRQDVEVKANTAKASTTKASTTNVWGPKPLDIKLDGTVHTVQFNLPTSVERAGPIRLQRVEDRQWLPMRHNTAGLTLSKGKKTILQLSPGTYELQDPIAPDRTQRFTVLGSTVIEVSAQIAPVPDGHL